MSGLHSFNRILSVLGEIIGQPASVRLNTNILSHSLNSYQCDPSGETFGDIYLIGDDENKSITIDDIIDVFEEINNNELFNKEFKSGRTYWFEGIRKSRTVDNTYEIIWES